MHHLPSSAFFLTLLSTIVLGACSSSSAATAPASAEEVTPAPESACPDRGATRCDGLRITRCDDRTATWTAPEECPENQTCKDDACQDPKPRTVSQSRSIDALVDALEESSAWHAAVDANAVKARERRAVLKGDGSDLTFVASAWHVMNAFPQGHQQLCGQGLPLQQSSRFGVCGRPSPAGLVVTYARAQNQLGVVVGDTITQAGPDSGDAIFEAAYARPVCGAVFPATSGRRHAGAASFFGTVPAGTKLAITAGDGSRREVDVPAKGDAKPIDCTDPFARNRSVYAEATVRPDGVAVIRLPSFYPFDKQLSANPTAEELDAFVADYQAEVKKVFDTVKSAPKLIWDTRGNTGGITSVGLAIVSGFPSARKTALSYCRSRTPGSSPPAFDRERYAVYGIEPGGPFAYAGKVAVVTDGLAYSAGDYFPRAVLRASDVPVIGSSSAGAYGGGQLPLEIAGPPKLSANADPTACFDAATDMPLEGAPLAPTIAVEYDAADLARGRDTVLERAIEAFAR